MEITPTTDFELIGNILRDEKLFAVTTGSWSNVERLNVKVDPLFNYLLITQDNEILGCFQVRPLSIVTVDCHINILSQYWGTGCGIKATHSVFKWLINNTQYNKVFTDVPAKCVQVIKLMDKLNAKPCGLIREGCVYDKQLTDLILYSYTLRDPFSG